MGVQPQMYTSFDGAVIEKACLERGRRGYLGALFVRGRHQIFTGHAIVRIASNLVPPPFDVNNFGSLRNIPL